MSKLILKINDRYLWRNSQVTLTELSADRAFVSLPGDQGVRVVKVNELEAIPVEAGFSEHSMMVIPQDEWKNLTQLRDKIDALLDLPKGVTKAVRKAADEIGCTERQMFRYVRTYRESPTIFALRAAKSGKPAGIKLLGIEREQLIEQCIELHYLNRERPSVAKLHNAIQNLCVLKGLKPPCLKAISIRVRRLGLEVRLRRREGGKVAKETLKGVPGHINVERLLDRIEIDHTLIDAILRADTAKREVIGRPWLTVAIDCKSRMILGFYIGFERPSVASVAACLAMAALPKDSWLKEMGITGSWPAQGKPKHIWVDNAMEFRSEALRRGCEQHQIFLNFRPVGSPEFGGMIERLIGTLMGEVHLLPGTTHSSVSDRGDYESEQRAVMTLSEFIPWFTEHIVTQYHLRPHRGLGISPLKAWELEVGNADIRVPSDPFEYYASFLPAEKRKLTRTGISLYTENYWSDEFSPWIGEGLKVQVHYHKMNVDKVYVRLPDGRIAVAAVQRNTSERLSLIDRHHQNASKRVIAKDPVLLKAAAEGWQRNNERLEIAQNLTRVAKRDGVKDGNEDKASAATLPIKLIPTRSAVALEQFAIYLED